MKISVFGLGYVGVVSAACFASRGNEVVGVDVSRSKVDLVNAGISTIVEDRIGDIVADVVGSGKLHATDDVTAAVLETEISLICVGTPSASNGSLSTSYLERVSDQIGDALAGLNRRHTVVFRSTMLPGTCLDLLLPILERRSGKRAGPDFGLAVNPEFLREGTSVKDFFDPPKTVIGEIDAMSGDLVTELYRGLPGGVFRVPIPVAEMTKYADNSFHALKIGFANELGAICRALGLDSHAVMDIFLADSKLNVSPAYLRPGFAFGGSCLPKDLRSLVYAARRADVSIPILEHILPSNDHHLRRAFEAIASVGKRRVGIFGLSFKPGTDDLRESPLVELSERLIGKGYDLRIYDEHVALSRLIGANKDYIESHLPHVADLLCDSVGAVFDHAEICVVGTKDASVLALLATPGDRVIVDLVRLPDAQQRRGDPGYIGVAW